MNKYREDYKPEVAIGDERGRFHLRIVNTNSLYQVLTTDTSLIRWVEVEYFESGGRESTTTTAEKQPWQIVSAESTLDEKTRPFFWNAIRSLREAGHIPDYSHVLDFHKIYARPLNPP